MAHRFISFITTLVLGYLIGVEIFLTLNAFIFLLSIIRIISSESLYGYSWYKPISILIYLFLITSFIVLAFRARKRKNVFYKIFHPRWQNLVVNLIFFIIFLFIAFFVGRGTLLSLDSQSFSLYSLNTNPLRVVIVLVVTLFYFYPFSAVIYYLKQNLKSKDKKLLNYKLLLILFLIFINPITISYGYFIHRWYWFSEDIKSNRLSKCGVQITAINKEGPAEKAGVRVYDLIYEIDGEKTQNTDALINYLNTLDSQKPVTLKTQLNTYIVYPQKDQQTGKYRLGVSVKQGYCNK